MTQGVAEAGAAAVALQLPRVAIFMEALTEARLTLVVVGSAAEVALEVVVVMLAGPQDTEAGAVELPLWRIRVEKRYRNSRFPFWQLHEFSFETIKRPTRFRLIHWHGGLAGLRDKPIDNGSLASSSFLSEEALITLSMLERAFGGSMFECLASPLMTSCMLHSEG